MDLFAMNDPGEKDLTGGLIIAPFGKGNFASQVPLSQQKYFS